MAVENKSLPELSESDVGARCETMVLVERYNKKGECEVFKKDDEPIVKDPYTAFALVTKQTFDTNHKLTETRLEINSPYILAAFKEVITYYPGHPLGFTSKVVLSHPFMMLFHHRNELRDYRKTSKDDTAKMHVMLLLDYLEKEAGHRDAEIEQLLTAKLIKFSLLWLLFKPGVLLYQSYFGHDRMYRLISIGYGENMSLGPYFELHCSFISYDGCEVGTANEKLRIYEKLEFMGTTPSNIVSLSVCPIKFIDAQDTIRQKLRERGDRYLSIREMCIVQYNGMFLYLRRPPYGYYNESATYGGTWLQETASGRVIIDSKTFNEEARAQKEKVNSSNNKGKGKNLKEDSHDNLLQLDRSRSLGDSLQKELTPPYVYGFSMEKKEWCKFFIDNLEPVKWKPNAFDSLILPDNQKRLLRALVTSHKFPERARDEMALKGKGLVVLLHGSPGSGKTFTAEMTAEHTKRGLLNISTGELGSYGKYIEVALKRLLTYASTFGAIILIDEADVFLEARGDSLEQNATIAVFLRQLEYFQGILFLTSNRVRVFDPAIKSRIHLALQYGPPSIETRRLLWKSHLDSVPSSEKEDNFDLEAALEAVVDAEMNGRVISNSISTARTLAKSEDMKLRIDDLKTIVQVWEDFEKTLAMKGDMLK